MNNLDEIDDLSNWIAMGNGNYTTTEELKADGLNEKQINFVCQLGEKHESAFTGLCLYYAGVGGIAPYHFHSATVEGWNEMKDEYLKEFQALGE